MMKKIMSSPVNPLNINDESQSSDTHFMQDLLRMVPPEDVEMVNQIQRKMFVSPVVSICFDLLICFSG